ncbi:hypothetical protein GDO81_026549 [Engystomops pustulosus]|uniref:C2H2-type domain-containing protein n=1 Tax=Engystomops pustulosus TaxID=76066 RepID=A0AAV6ZW90_ENGPU|nr:hypothetical protein GDO81_026549 [Engystomops pustulosus]
MCIRHQLSHTRPFSCSDCDKRFSRKSLLTKHRDTHLKEKSVSCPPCEEPSSVKSQLGAPERIHTGETSLIIHNVGNRDPKI